MNIESLVFAFDNGDVMIFGDASAAATYFDPDDIRSSRIQFYRGDGKRYDADIIEEAATPGPLSRMLHMRTVSVERVRLQLSDEAAPEEIHRRLLAFLIAAYARRLGAARLEQLKTSPLDAVIEAVVGLQSGDV